MQEIFQGAKYKMSVEEDGFVHKLVISNPTTNDMGKFTCDCNGITTSAFLDVDGKNTHKEIFYADPKTYRRIRKNALIILC